MGKVNYLLVDMSILPSVYAKVIEAKGYLASGDASSASQAAKMAGISRSAYYKYKDKIFEYNGQNEDVTTIDAKLVDNAGVLSAVISQLYQLGANILSVNQSIPVNNIADVSITVSVADMKVDSDELLESISSVGGVKSAKII